MNLSISVISQIHTTVARLKSLIIYHEQMVMELQKEIEYHKQEILLLQEEIDAQEASCPL